MDLPNPARFDGGDEGGVGIEREVCADPAFQAELLAIGRQKQLNGGRAEADAVIEPLDSVGRVDPLDGEHRRQDLRLGDRGRVAGEQRLDIEGLLRLDHEMYEVAGNVDAGQLVHDLGHLRDDEPALVAGRLHHRRRVLGVGAGIEIAVAIGADGRDQGHLRREVDEIAGKEFEIGVDGAELDLAAKQQPRDAGCLRSGIGIIELARDALLEHIEMLGQHDT